MWWGTPADIILEIWAGAFASTDHRGCFFGGDGHATVTLEQPSTPFDHRSYTISKFKGDWTWHRYEVVAVYVVVHEDADGAMDQKEAALGLLEREPPTRSKIREYGEQARTVPAAC